MTTITDQLHAMGQSLWLDNITRGLIDSEALAAQLQSDGAASFVKSWEDMLSVVAAKASAVS